MKDLGGAASVTTCVGFARRGGSKAGQGSGNDQKGIAIWGCPSESNPNVGLGIGW